MAASEMLDERLYRRKVMFSYAVDVACLLIFGGAASLIEFIPPRQIEIPANDPSINLPVAGTIWVPNSILPVNIRNIHKIQILNI